MPTVAADGASPAARAAAPRSTDVVLTQAKPAALQPEAKQLASAERTQPSWLFAGASQRRAARHRERNAAVEGLLTPSAFTP